MPRCSALIKPSRYTPGLRNESSDYLKGSRSALAVSQGFGTKNAVSKAIARLVKRGELERVYRGIYMRPKPGLYVARGSSQPLAIDQRNCQAEALVFTNPWCQCRQEVWAQYPDAAYSNLLH
ncbi:type IV toxin-antitoxin system AbiEi family antitoxin domain-containing protein [Pseudomonas aeruginosa]|nr:type IV toxin-antitoxin system AbiEi family antitoxin domain-containing protein [Pseudomonas aeruginosa]